jgi:hypothetical protein
MWEEGREERCGKREGRRAAYHLGSGVVEE